MVFCSFCNQLWSSCFLVVFRWRQLWRVASPSTHWGAMNSWGTTGFFCWGLGKFWRQLFRKKGRFSNWRSHPKIFSPEKTTCWFFFYANWPIMGFLLTPLSYCFERKKWWRSVALFFRIENCCWMSLLLIRGIFGGRLMSWNVIGKPYRNHHHLRKLRCPQPTGWPTTLKYRDQKLRLAKLLPACFSRKYICFLVKKNPDDATTLGFHPKAPFASDLVSPRASVWLNPGFQVDPSTLSTQLFVPPIGYVCAMATCYLWRIWNPNGSHGTLKRKSNQLKEKGHVFFAKNKDPTQNLVSWFLLENCWCHFVGGGSVFQVDWLG